MEDNKFMIGEIIQRQNPNGELVGHPFVCTNNEFKFQDGRFVKVAYSKDEYDTLVKERQLLIEALNGIIKDSETQFMRYVDDKPHDFKSLAGRNIEKAKELLNNLQIKTT